MYYEIKECCEDLLKEIEEVRKKQKEIEISLAAMENLIEWLEERDS